MKSPCCNFLIAIDADGVKRCAKYGCLQVISSVEPVPLWTEPKEVEKPFIERPYVIGEDSDEIDYPE